MGRPTDYNDELADLICDRLSEGESLLNILRDAGMPSRQTIYRWLRDDDKQSFRDNYDQARIAGADKQFDELYETALKAEPENVSVHKLQIDTMKWCLARKLPKKYGDRIEVDQKTELNAKVEMTHDKALAVLAQAGIDPDTLK